MMTKKDYQKFATMFKQVIKQTNEANYTREETINCIMTRVMCIFSEDSYKFNHSKFTEWVNKQS